MTTYQDLQTRILRRLIDTPAAVAAEVPTLVNDVYAEVQREHKFWEAQATLKVATTEGTHLLAALPSDWGGFRDSRGYLTTDLGDSRHVTLSKSRMDIFLRWNKDIDIGEPRMVVWGEPSGDTATSSLWVWPLPDGNSDYEDGEYQVRVPYWRVMPKLVNANDQTWLTDLATTYIIAEGTRRGFMLDWDENRADFWAKESATQKKELFLADKDKWLHGAEPFVPYPDVLAARIPE